MKFISLLLASLLIDGSYATSSSVLSRPVEGAVPTRSECTAFIGSNNRICIMGGRTTSTDINNNNYVGCSSFFISSNSWVTSTVVSLEPRIGAVVVSYSDQNYVVGGKRARDDAPLNTIMMISMTETGNYKAAQTASYNTPGFIFYGHQAMVVEDTLYIYGIQRSNGESYGNILKYSFKTSTWAELAVPSDGILGPVPRSFATMSVYAQFIFVYGGIQLGASGVQLQGTTNDFWAFNTASQTWIQLNSSPVALAGAHSFFSSPNLYFLGGYQQIRGGSPTANSNVYTFDLVTQKWANTPARSNAINPPVRLACGVFHNNEYYMFGGVQDGGAGSNIVTKITPEMTEPVTPTEQQASETGPAISPGVWIVLSILILLLIIVLGCMVVIFVRRYNRLQEIRRKRKVVSERAAANQERKEKEKEKEKRAPSKQQAKKAVAQLQPLNPQDYVPSFMDELTMLAQDIAAVPGKIGAAMSTTVTRMSGNGSSRGMKSKEKQQSELQLNESGRNVNDLQSDV